MTAVLNEIRALDARRDRGELTPEQYATLRARVLHNIEDAETQFIDITPAGARPAKPRAAQSRAPEPGTPERSASSAISFSIVVCLGVMGLCIGMSLLFLPDLNLALTLGVTILAALSVALLRETGE